jgi:hypothetical protein
MIQRMRSRIVKRKVKEQQNVIRRTTSNAEERR